MYFQVTGGHFSSRKVHGQFESISLNLNCFRRYTSKMHAQANTCWVTVSLPANTERKGWLVLFWSVASSLSLSSSGKFRFNLTCRLEDVTPQVIRRKQDGRCAHSILLQNPLPLGRAEQCRHRQLDLPNVLQSDSDASRCLCHSRLYKERLQSWKRF